MSETNSRHASEPTDAAPTQEVRPDPEAAAEPVEVHNSFATNPTRQESWLSYLRSNDRAEEADKLEAELNANKVV